MMNNTFDDIENVTLRTWNRAAVALNLYQDKGEAASQLYLEKLSKRSQKQVYFMLGYIERNGYEKVKREVHRGIKSE